MPPPLQAAGAACWGAALPLALMFTLLLLRLAFVLAVPRRFPSQRGPLKALIVLGSGGHTAEMLMLLETIDRGAYSPRVYVAAESDAMSARRALAREAAWAGGEAPPRDVDVETIPRSREVGQSYVTSVFTTLYSLMFAAGLVLRHRPQLVLVNGPGTCIPICACAFICRGLRAPSLRVFSSVLCRDQGVRHCSSPLHRLLCVADSRVVYVESIARVRKLSLSGALLYSSRLADMFFVQWPELQARFPRTCYAGRLY